MRDWAVLIGSDRDREVKMMWAHAGRDRMMGCLFALFVGCSPRLAHRAELGEMSCRVFRYQPAKRRPVRSSSCARRGPAARRAGRRQEAVPERRYG